MTHAHAHDGGATQGSDVEIGGGGVGAVQVEAVLAAEEEGAHQEADAAAAKAAQPPPVSGVELGGPVQ